MPDETTRTAQGGSTPKTDPSALTTDALAREMSTVEDKLKAAKELFDEKVAKERELREKDVEAVNRELTLLDKQRTESKKSDADALAAALSAAKEAVQQNNLNFEKAITKTENATNDLIKSLGEQFNTVVTGLNNTIADWKDRVTKAEQTLASHVAAQTGQEKGGDRQVKTEGEKLAWVVAIFSAVGLAASIIIQLSH
jgi:hypothetical protein